MLEVQHLAVRYRDTQGLESLSFQVNEGQIVGVIGPNGAGKSTLLKAMLGLIPSHGLIQYCACPLCQQLQRVAYMPQRSQIDWDYPITVRQVVMMAFTRQLGWFKRPNSSHHQRAEQALAQVEMDHLGDRRIGDLSGGQQQRVFLARALAQDADIFLLDEPFTGVDVKTEAILFRIFQQLKQSGKILLVSTHEWGKSLYELDRLLLLNRSLIADGVPNQVMTPENLHRAFGTSFPVHHPGSAWDNSLAC